MSLKSTILSVTRRTKNGLTSGEIFDRVQNYFLNRGLKAPRYNVVRARVSELAAVGALVPTGARADSLSGFTATTFRRNS